jgi:DNA repair protein SbcD/Mre11
MKTPLTIIFSDLHIHLHNEEEIINITHEIIKQCLINHIKTAICLGDVFDSRKSQPLQSLKTFEKVLQLFIDMHIDLICIPGNHDKISYISKDSYLDQYQYWPGFRLIRDYEYIDLFKGIRFHFIPYFEEETTYIKYLEQVELKYEQNYLFTHIGIDGVLNNSKEEVKNPVTKDIFKQFDDVFIGHYHNSSDHGNIHYIGSIKPNNFGEDNNKGCTILYDDGSFELIPLTFKKYEKIVIDIDSFDNKKEQELLKEYSKSDNHIRFEFVGDSSKLKSLDKMKFESVGIDITVKNKEVEETVNIVEYDEFIEFDDKSLLVEFDEFCKINDLTDIEIGQDYLNHKLYGKEKLSTLR